MSAEQSRISESNARLLAWLEAQNYRGYDPYDALNSPLLRMPSRRNLFVGVAFTQLVRRLPFNLRPLLGIAPDYNPKGMGLFLASFVRRYAALREPQDLERAHFFAHWLRDHAATDYQGIGWGYPFDWANRNRIVRQGTPTIVNTAFIAQALLDYAQTCNATWAFEVARRACDFILYDLNRYTDVEGICFSYSPRDSRYVHNANLLGAALLARVGTQTGERELIETAKRAVHFTVEAQEADGRWRYGLSARDGWVDNFHTGFVLAALADVIDALGCQEWESALSRGYRYWQSNFFREDGAPKYYNHSVYPIDVHCVAQAVLVWLRMRTRDHEAGLAATRTLKWGIEHFQDKSGYFYYQLTPLYKNRIPYIRWSNAWMLRAQAEWLWGESFQV